MADEVVLVSDSLGTPTVPSGVLTDAQFFIDNEIDFTEDFTHLFDDATFITNTSASSDAVTVAVDRDTMEQVYSRLTLLQNVEVKNVDDVINVLNGAKGRAPYGSGLIGLTREDIDILSKFSSTLPAIDSDLQELKDDAGLLLKPMHLSDVTVLPSNDFTDKVAAALNDDAYVDEKLEESTVITADMGVESVGGISTSMDSVKCDVKIEDFGDIINSNTDNYKRELLVKINEGLDALFSARNLLVDMRALSPIDVTSSELALLDGTLSILEQDWSGTTAVLTTLGAAASGAAYTALIVEYDRASRKSDVVTYYANRYALNSETIDFFSDAVYDNVQVIGQSTGKTYTLAQYRSVLSTLKNIWTRLVSRVADSTVLSTVVDAAKVYVDSKLVNVNKTYGTSFTVDNIKNTLINGFGAVSSANTTTALQAVITAGSSVVPLLYRGMSNKVTNNSMDKSKLLARAKRFATSITSEVQASDAYTGILRRYRVQRTKRFAAKSINSMTIELRARRAAKAYVLARINS